jgi:hypothetical protein
MIGGKAVYGDGALKALSTSQCEDMEACGATKFACVALTSQNDKLDQTYAQIKAILETALVDMDGARPAGGANFAPLTPVASCK